MLNLCTCVTYVLLCTAQLRCKCPGTTCHSCLVNSQAHLLSTIWRIYWCTLVCVPVCSGCAGIVAGMLVQNTLKYLLEFGSVSHYLGYNSLKDFFPTMDIKPNTACSNSRCLEAQQAYQVGYMQQDTALHGMQVSRRAWGSCPRNLPHLLPCDRAS